MNHLPGNAIMLMHPVQTKIAGHKASRSCHAKGMEGGFLMDSAMLWQLFFQTGRPEAYTFYRRVSQVEEHRIPRQRKPEENQLR